jgi:hypothetical protein
MNPREIVARAWAITTGVRTLRRWGYTASVLETLLETKLILYQSHFVYSYLVLGRTVGFFEIEEMLYRNLPFWAFLTFIITFTVAVLIEFVLPKACLGAVIGLGAKAGRKEELKGGLVLAIYNFWPIFAIAEMFVLSRITTSVVAISFILRYVEGGFSTPGVTFVIVAWAFSNILKFFASFAEEAVVIRKFGIFHAIGHSFKLVLSYLKDIMFLVIILIMISLRIFINFIVALLIPGIAIGVGVALSFFLPPVISYSVTAVVSVVVILFLSYLLAYLQVFKQMVWTLTYLELSAKKELDIIIEPSAPATAAAGTGNVGA